MKRFWGLGIGFLMVLWVAAGAMADEILFPWVVKSPTISTIISVVNTDDLRVQNKLHFLYRYKRSGDCEASCEHADFYVPSSPNDVFVFDAAGNINDGKPLFGDTAVKGLLVDSYPYTIRTLKNIACPTRAYLIVENSPFAEDNTLYGEAMIVELATGAAWGYAAYNPERRGDFTSDRFGEVLAPDEAAKMVIMPIDRFTTRVFVTPVSDNLTEMKTKDLTIQVGFYYDEDGTFMSGFYGHDEDSYSLGGPRTVVCTGVFDVAEYVTEIFADVLSVDAGGAEGWAYVKTITPPKTEKIKYPADGACVGKLEFNVGSTALDGTTIPGSTNNFIWLRGTPERAPVLLKKENNEPQPQPQPQCPAQN